MKRPVPLPPAETPWPEPDSIEGEIVQALKDRSAQDSSDGDGAVGPKQDDAGPELGDLAERLEEALALEVRAAGRDRGGAEPDSDAFAFGQARPRRDAAVERRIPPRQLSAAPEPEARRDKPAERKDEAPVISLDTHRKDAPDPIEDEMARLLGELTGDANRR